MKNLGITRTSSGDNGTAVAPASATRTTDLPTSFWSFFFCAKNGKVKRFRDLQGRQESEKGNVHYLRADCNNNGTARRTYIFKTLLVSSAVRRSNGCDDMSNPPGKNLLPHLFLSLQHLQCPACTSYMRTINCFQLS